MCKDLIEIVGRLVLFLSSLRGINIVMDCREYRLISNVVTTFEYEYSDSIQVSYMDKTWWCMYGWINVRDVRDMYMMVRVLVGMYWCTCMFVRVYVNADVHVHVYVVTYTCWYMYMLVYVATCICWYVYVYMLVRVKIDVKKQVVVAN